jgi:hypothetical protein
MLEGCFNEVKGKENADYHPVSGICFETQNFPDAPLIMNISQMRF